MPDEIPKTVLFRNYIVTTLSLEMYLRRLWLYTAVTSIGLEIVGMQTQAHRHTGYYEISVEMGHWFVLHAYCTGLHVAHPTLGRDSILV